MSRSPRHSGDEDRAAREGGLATFGALVLCLALLSVYRGFAGDDTFIHLQYARNVADARGFAFNPGEPSYGTTSPLWTLLVAGAGALIGDRFYVAAKLLSVAATVLCIPAFAAVLRRLGARGAVVGLGTLAFVLDPWLLKWGASGMETSFALLLVLLSLRLHLVRRVQGGMPASAFLLGLGTLVRPELVALFGVLLFDRLFIARRPAGETLFAIFLYLVPVLPWALYAYTTFGSIVPTTIEAKSGHMAWGTSAWRAARILGATYGPAVVAIAAGAVLALRRVPARRVRAWLGDSTVLWGWMIGLPVAFVVTGSYVASRYLLIASPLLTLLAFAATCLVASRRRRMAAAGLFAALALTSAVIQASVVYPRTRFANGVDDNLIAVGRWLAANTPADALVATHEVGAVGYFAGRRILDTAGLVTPWALPYVVSYEVPRLIAEARPDYYVSSGDERTDRQVLPVFRDRLTLLHETTVQRGGSSKRFAVPLRVGIYRFDWSDPPATGD